MRLAILLLMATTGALHPQETARPTPPQVIHKIDPVYTKEAIKAKLEGTVVIDFTVGTDGIPSHLRVVRGLGEGLDAKAIECLQAWRFKPATLHGEAISVNATAEINFRLPPPRSK